MPTSGDSSTRVPPPAAAAPDAGPDGDVTAAPASDEAKASRLPTGPIKRGAALRRELVAKLSQLAVAGDSAGAMKVDPGAVDLDADAFIGPLHALVSEGRS
jgi:hypothetical protein